MNNREADKFFNDFINGIYIFVCVIGVLVLVIIFWTYILTGLIISAVVGVLAAIIIGLCDIF